MKIFIKAYVNKNLGDDLFLKILNERYYKNNTFLITEKAKYLNLRNTKYYNCGIIEKIINKIKSKLKINYIKKYQKKCDVSIYIGGSIFIEKEREVYPYEGVGKYFVIGSNFGPYKSKRYLKKTKEFFECAEDVCLRDNYSYEKFKELKNVRKASDVVFNLDTTNIKISQKQVIIISIINCFKKCDSKIVEVYNYMLLNFIEENKRKYKIILMSFCENEGDREAVDYIYNRIKDKNNIGRYYYNGNINEALNIIANSEIIIGSRFHANIIGLILKKKIIPLAYSDKTINVLKDMNFNGIIYDLREISENTQIRIEDAKTLKINRERENAINQFLAFDKFERMMREDDQ